MRQLLAITRKELTTTFGSPLALIFIGAFLVVTLFTFFWVEAFFARGIADVRPLFRWMPILLIFLVAALTMRQWSEEERSGTLEMLLTLPLRPLQLVIGKFLAVLLLVALSLALTLGLPITVAVIGNLDWGPVIGGYLAALLLAAAYIAIGLFVSSRTDNQIVSLILTVLLAGLFYLLGSSGVLGFAGGRLAAVLRALGTGTRFESIERGVIDLRDLVYYLSLTGIFLVLNVLSLDSKRWSRGARTLPHRRTFSYMAALVVLNLLLVNVWLFPLLGLRLDITQDHRYSLSQTTRDLLGTLQEPLLIRAYLSEKTHPLLAPLEPQVRDLLREYQIASGGRAQAEVVDPQQHPDLEAEANRTYGIRPHPFQVASRYENSVVNAYFDILIRYGDQSEVLSFDDLIEVVPSETGAPDVRLRNLEYDLTRAIKKTVFGFQSTDALLASLPEPAKLTLFATPDRLPEKLVEVPNTIQAVAEKLQQEADGNFLFETIDPQAPDSPVSPEELQSRYGIQPIPLSLFSSDGYYLHMLLTVGDTSQVVYPSGDLSEAAIRSAIESALQRASPGFLKVVGIWTPPPPQGTNPFGQQQPQLYRTQLVSQQLGRDYKVQHVDLSKGQVPPEVDVLLVLAPQNMSDSERYAIDQFLMRGGSVVVATGSYAVTTDFSGGLALRKIEGGISDMLAHYGITVGDELVLDSQNTPFPVTVARNVGGFQVQEIRAIDYPFFVDVRPGRMARNHLAVANLSEVTMNWASPLTVEETAGENREATVLLRSSPESWLRSQTDIEPDFDSYPQLGFPVEGDRQERPLAVAIQGTFASFFKDKPSPLEADSSEGAAGAEGNSGPGSEGIGTITSSPDNARLVVIGSSEFINDTILQLASRLGRDTTLNNLQFLQNVVDWAAEDTDLLSIRARGAHTRVLKALSPSQETAWETGNYLVALLALLVIGAWWQLRHRRERPMALITPPAIDKSRPLEGGRG